MNCIAARTEQRKADALSKFAEDLNVSDLKAFARTFSILKLPKGATVFAAGSVADRIYVVAQGQVWVQNQGGQGYQSSSERPSHVVTVGHAFGIEALYTEARPRIHTAQVSSLDGAILLYLKRDDYVASASSYIQHYRHSNGVSGVLGDLPFMVDNQESRQKVQFLRKIPFLSSASDMNLRLLAPCFTFRVYHPGEVIFEAASYPDTLHYLIEGQVVVSQKTYMSVKDEMKIDDEGTEEVVQELQRGCVGELDLLLNLPGRCRTAKVVDRKRNTKTRVGRGDELSAEDKGEAFGGNAHFLTIGRYSFDNYLLYCDNSVRKALRQLPIDSTVKVVSKVPFFSRMAPASLAKLAQVCRRQYLEADEVLFRAGDTPDDEAVFFIVEFGSVLVYTPQNNDMEGEEGESKGEDVVARLCPGMYFGELSLLTDSPRRASIRGGGRHGDMATILLGISKSDFEDVIQAEPEARAECALRILGKKSDLATILIHPESYKIFAEHLRKVFSEESALFWRAVHAYEVMCFTRALESGILAEEDTAQENKADEDDKDEIDESSPPRALPLVQLEDEDDEGLWHEVSLLVAIEDSLEATKESKRRVDMVMKDGLAKSKTHATLLVQKWEMKRFATRIIDKFIAVDAPCQVNVKSAMRQKIEAARDNNVFDPEIFKECKNECFKLMANNDLEVFLDSQPFQQLISDLGAYSRTSESLNAARMWEEYAVSLRTDVKSRMSEDVRSRSEARVTQRPVSRKSAIY